MATATSAAVHLPVGDREPFLQAVQQLAGPNPGPGVEHRAVVAVFPTVWKPPSDGRACWDISQDIFRPSKLRSAAPIEYGGDLRHVRYRKRAS